MTDHDKLAQRIKLAEAMGWVRDGSWGAWILTVREGHREICRDPNLLPDPFTDANDDYCVLEWAIKNLDPDAYFAALTDVVGSYAYLHEYRIGYFASAALKVIDDE